MGIKSLNKFLRNNCPQIFEEIHISEYSFKKVAIDISLYLCKYKTICGDDWLSSFIGLVSCLRRNEVHCVFIYDTGAPPEKALERKERAEQRRKLEEKVYKYEEALEKYHLTSEVDPVLVELYKKRKGKLPSKRLLRGTEETVNIPFLEDVIKKMRGQILNISPKDFELTKKLFDVLNVPYFQAPLEAETTCADLCKRGLVDAVLSEDTDVMAYASPIFLSKINTYNDTCVRINYSKLLQALELSSAEFLDLCIMCGTDYNKNIFRVGPEKAYKHIQTYSSIEEIGKNTKLDISILNHIRGRELFREYEQKKIKIPYCGTPKLNMLSEFVLKHNVRISMSSLKKDFIHSVAIVFKEDEQVKYKETKNSIEISCSKTVTVLLEKGKDQDMNQEECNENNKDE